MKYRAVQNEFMLGGIGGILPMYLPNGEYTLKTYSMKGQLIGFFKVKPKRGFEEKCLTDYYKFKNAAV